MSAGLEEALSLATHVELVSATIDLMRGDPSREVECLGRLAAARDELARTDDGRADALATRLGLSSREMSVVWLLIAFATRADIKSTAKLLAGDPGEDPTLACIQLVAYGNTPSLAAMDDLGARGTLRRLGVLVRSAASSSDSRAGWIVAPRVLRWLLGDDGIDPELIDVARLCQPAPRATEGGTGTPTYPADAIIVACAQPGFGRRTFLHDVAARFDTKLLEVDSRKLSPDAATFRAQVQALARECKLLELTPCVLHVDALVDDADAARFECLTEILSSEVEGPLLMSSGRKRPTLRGDRPVVVVELEPPTAAARATQWLTELGQGTRDDGEYLATQFPLAPSLIHRAANAAKARANGNKMSPEDIYAGVRAVLDDRLGDYAKRVDVTQSWDDLVLAQDHIEQIQYLIARIRQRRTVYEQWGFAAKVGKGLGTSALLSGPPGTGKTMVAALIAKDLGLELYQVDMAKITSKYIGETERNLGAVFDAAEAGHAILLFDEADSLFGKRTEVKSSNDRYANLETNYLLQRLESFTGICLLTSNHESNIDPAFQRRLSLHIRFELPEADERAALWRAMLPAAAPIADGVDFLALATRFAMSGGYIRNAALRAAFLAADEGSAITGQYLERAARLEYEGMGKIAFGETADRTLDSRGL